MLAVLGQRTKLRTADSAEVAGNPCPRDIDAVHTCAVTDARELIATDPRTLTMSAYGLLGQQDEPPKR